MKEDPNDPRKVLASDMLAPEGYGEIIGEVREKTIMISYSTEY